MNKNLDKTPKAVAFTPEIQTQLLTCLLVKPEILEASRKALCEDVFDCPEDKILIKIMNRHRNKYRREITHAELAQEIRDHIRENPRSEAGLFTDRFNKITSCVLDDADFEYLRDKAFTFAQYQAIKGAIGDAVDIIMSGRDFERIREQVNAALAIGTNGQLDVENAFREYGGLPEAIRPDCLRSAVRVWRGAASALNERYRKYLEPLGVIVLPARPGTPEDKGKIEKRILDLFSRLDLRHRVYRDLEDLTNRARAILEESETTWRSGATGFSVAESFAYEKESLRPLPLHFSALPVKESRTRVRRDGTVFFDGNYYQVPGLYRDRAVLCRHTGHEILIDHEGDEIGRFAALPQARGMVRLSVQALEDPEIHLSERVRMWGLEVARRQVQIYQEMSR